MLQPKKTLIRTPKSELTRVTRKATDEEAARFGMKKSQDYKDRPKTMATKPMSQVPGKDLPSKLNAAVEKAKSYGRNVSSVSKEFDGKEVQGKRIESRGGKKVKEVYSMPGGGKRVEKERYNQAGNIVSRKIKDTKIN
jgi:hypothetical protein